MFFPSSEVVVLVYFEKVLVNRQIKEAQFYRKHCVLTSGNKVYGSGHPVMINKSLVPAGPFSLHGISI